MEKINQVDKSDLEKIQVNQEKRSSLIENLGELELEKAKIIGYLQLIERESNLISKELAKKYGEVTVNTDTGVYTPKEKEK